MLRDGGAYEWNSSFFSCITTATGEDSLELTLAGKCNALKIHCIYPKGWCYLKVQINDLHVERLNCKDCWWGCDIAAEWTQDISQFECSTEELLFLK